MKSWLLIWFTLFIIKAFPQKQFAIDEKTIDRYIETEMTRWNVPGCAIAIVRGNDLLYTKDYGYRDVENKLPVTPNTVFKIASLTKSFTAAATGILVNQKLLDWDTPVKKYLPELEFVNTELANNVTLKDLLTHRTGLYDDDWSWVGDHIDTKRMYEILSVMPQEKPLRTDFLYANMTYALAGHLIGIKTNSSWRDVIRKKFFEPLSMTSSLFSHNEKSGSKDFAFGYEWCDSLKSYLRGNLSEHLTDSLSVCEAFAFISSSAVDLSKWIQLFINGGNWRGEQLIPADILKELTRPVNYIHASRYPELTERFYCMGWEQNYYKTHKLLQHSGGLSGFKSYMSFMPQDSMGIIVLTNGQPYRFAEAVSYDLYDLVLSLPATHWSDKFLSGQKTKSGDIKNADTIIPGTTPSKPLAEYAGIYFSKWLGAMKVIYENGELFFQFHTYPKEKMSHTHYNTFRADSGNITFQFSHEGKITGMVLNEYYFDKSE